MLHGEYKYMLSCVKQHHESWAKIDMLHATPLLTAPYSECKVHEVST